jgi:hypothetical protein
MTKRELLSNKVATWHSDKTLKSMITPQEEITYPQGFIINQA